MKKLLLLLIFSNAIVILNSNAQNWNEMLKVCASDRGNSDLFGYSVAISGNHAVVGAYNEDQDASGGATLSNAGSVYVFELTGDVWAFQQKLVASDRGVDDQFGSAVAISGDYIIVGANMEDQDASGGATLAEAGSAYIFVKSGGVWAQQQKLVAPDRATTDAFAYSVAIDGDYAVAGAWKEDENASGGATMADAGSVYVFIRAGTVWSFQQKLVTNDRHINDFLGTSVSISGDYVIAGSEGNDYNATGGGYFYASGAAYIFHRTGTVWSQQQKLVGSDRDDGDFCGHSVSISGDYAVVAAYNDDEDVNGVNPLPSAGSAYIFKNNGVTWTQQQKIIASDRTEADYFASSVSISGDYLLVGAPKEDHDANGGNSMNNAGSAYAFRRIGNTWSQRQKIVASDRSGGDEFGTSVSISGPYLFSGAQWDDQDENGLNPLTNSGSAYIFKPIPLQIALAGLDASCYGACDGKAAVVTTGGWEPFTFTWNDINSQTTDSAVGLCADTITVIVSDNLGSILTDSIIVSEPLPLIAPIVTINGITLESDQATGNSWYMVGNSNILGNLQTYTPVVNGNYYVIYTDNNGCSASSDTIPILSVGINFINDNDHFIIYPNPVTNTLTIETESGKGIYQLQDLTGKQLLSGTITATKFSLDISTLSKGIYLLSVFDCEQVAHKKIVKE